VGEAGFTCEVHGYSAKTNDITALASFGTHIVLAIPFFELAAELVEENKIRKFSDWSITWLYAGHGAFNVNMRV